MENNTLSLGKNAHIHLMGICGVGMSSLAGMLKEKGYTVTGSDNNIYPPISTFLERHAIPVAKGYSASNLYPRPDLVIVGNVITKDNPEACQLIDRDLPYLSMPQALKTFAIGDKKSIVIAGTHGKTTTSALIAWILEVAGMNPSFMIGGIVKNFDNNFKLTDGDYFIVEGDEYDTAFFDKGPKFLHYNPYIAAITGIEFDHADIYKGIDEIKDSFKHLVALLPAQGMLCVNADDPNSTEVINHAQCPLYTYGIENSAHFTLGHRTIIGDTTQLTILKNGTTYLTLTTDLYGKHNISNILASVSIASYLNIGDETIVKAIETFKGVRRRLEVVGKPQDIMVIDDFAHHPTAVRETITAVKGHYKGHRVAAVFEPRSNSSRRNIFQDAYVSSFTNADLVIIPEPPMMEKIPTSERFSSPKLAADLKKRGIEAYYFPDTHALLDGLLALIKNGDIVLFMSNGPFDNIHGRFLQRLKGHHPDSS